MILFLHHRYRTTGGEEAAVERLVALVRDELGEDAQLLTRDSVGLRRARAGAGLLAGGLEPGEVAAAVRRTGARVVHAHNLHPTFGWRALAAAQAAGARVVAHLHQYRLVCANGVCFTHGEDCTRCHGVNTLPGLVHNCRGSRAEGVVYAAALSLWQRRLTRHVDAFIAPSDFAAGRLTALGARITPLRVIPHPISGFADGPASGAGGFALFAGRLSPEKGVEVAIDACHSAGLPLVVAGDGPLREALSRRAGGGATTFRGRLSSEELAELRREALLALVPSRSAESFGLAAAEALAAGLPVAASRVGALPELVPAPGLADPGDPVALAAAIGRVLTDRSALAQAGLRRVRALTAPGAVAAALGALYDEVCG